MLLKMIQETMASKDSIPAEMCLVNNCQGRIDHLLVQFCTPLIQRISGPKAAKTLKVEVLNTMASGLYYNADGFLQVLESQGWTDGVFTLWREHLTGGLLQPAMGEGV